MLDTTKKTVATVMGVLEELAPSDLAAPWDKIGLQLGDCEKPVEKVLVTLDITKEALAKARQIECDLIVCHHPLIFDPLVSLRSDDPVQHLIIDLACDHIAVLAAHTNLDASPGGVADCFADAIEHIIEKKESGIIKGQRETIGFCGKRIHFVSNHDASSLINQVKKGMGSPGIVINSDRDRKIRSIAAMPGAFGEEDLKAVLASGVDAVFCGESKHHIGVALDLAGILLVGFGHDITERVVLKPLAKRLAERLPGIKFDVYSGFDYNRIAF